jgi:hypothetical protein
MVLGFCSVAFAGDSLPDTYKNGLGWDNGFSYRHLVGRNTWLGLSLSGSITSSRNHSNDSQVFRDTLNDSITSLYATKNAVDQTNYSIKVSGILIGEITEYKLLGLNYFIQPTYSYTWAKNSNLDQVNNEQQNSDDKSQTLGAAVGVAPAITVFKRLCFETKFGLSYAYTWSRNYDTENSLYNSAYHYHDESSTYFHVISILGSPFSINMSFSGHFYF